MTTTLATRPANSFLATQTSDPFERIAAEEDSGAPIKFAKGEWLADDVVLNGSHMTAAMDCLAIGSRKWVDSKIVAADVGFVASGFQPKRREELGDLDENAWPVNSRGERTDPWQYGYFLRLTSDEGRAYTWAATSSGARRAVGNLARAYAKRRGSGSLPVVELKADFYRHKEFGKVDTPLLSIVGWTEGGDAPPALERAAGPAPVITSGPQKTAFVDDTEIPF